jgi:valyl-tRNA synthetase
MSKSLGNVIDPLEFIGRYGADALRYSLARIAGPDQQNLPLGERDVEAARNFANKIWNAARLVLGARDGQGPPALPAEADRSPVERWLLSRHEACREEFDLAMEEYRFADAAQTLHRFLWSEFCDWGLEMEKPRLYEGGPGEREAAAGVLAWVLERTLRLLHPIMPFLTEEVWQRFDAGDSIVVSDWPEPHPEHRDDDAERHLSFAESLVVAIRSFRSGHGLGPGARLEARVRADEAQRVTLRELDEEIRRLARLDRLVTADAAGDAGGQARLVVDGADVLIPLAGVLDTTAECARIRKRLDGIGEKAERSARKLDNEGFVSKAAPDVVAKERGKLAALEEERAVLEAQLAELGC